MSTIALKVNGKEVSAEVEDRTLLVELLRDELKSRVVDVLRPVYEELDDVRKLVALNRDEPFPAG